MATKVLEQQRLEELLGTHRGPTPKKRPRWQLAAAAVVLAGVGTGSWQLVSTPKAAAYGTAQRRRATIRKTISATGTLQAVTTVQVGTQVSGSISELYADFNSQVKKDQIIARLDPSQF